MADGKRKRARWADLSECRKDMHFVSTWERLAAHGRCDGAGGMEYCRVYAEWRRAQTGRSGRIHHPCREHWASPRP